MNVPSLSVIPRTFYVLLERVLSGVGFVKTGLNPTATGPGDRHVSVAAGSGVVNGVAFSYVGGTVLPAVADANPRYDLVVIASGASSPSVITGAPSNAPIAPTLPAGDLVLGLVYLPANATDYTTGGFVADYTMMYGLGNGTAASPSLPFTSDYTTGIYRPGAGKLGITISGGKVAEFGATYLAMSSTPALAGQIRLPNNDGMVARNAANTGDVGIAWLDTSNQISIGFGYGTTAAGVIVLPPFLSIGTTPASVGVIRIPNNVNIVARNAANSLDMPLIGSTSGDAVSIAPNGQGVTISGNITAPISFFAIGTNPALADVIRLPSGAFITARNVANSGNLRLLAQVGDNIEVGDAGIATPVMGLMAAAVKIPGYSTAAAAGLIRLPTNTSVSWRNNANTGDITVTKDTNDAYVFTGHVVAPAATTSIPSIRMPHGSAPSSPTNGDFWTTTAGLFGRINGATVTYGATPTDYVRILNKVNATTTVTNTVAESDLYRFTVPANTIGATGRLRLHLAGTHFCNDGVGQTMNFRVKFGGTTYGTWGIPFGSSTVRAPWVMDVYLANTTTGAQRTTGNFYSGGQSYTDWGMTVPQIGTGYKTSAEDTTANKDLAVTVQLGSANVNSDAKIEVATLEFLP